MGKIFEKITHNLVQNGNIREEDEDVYQYAMKSILVLGGNILLSLIIGVWMEVPGYCLLFLGAIILLRSDAGGYHASNLVVCYILSLVSLMLTMFIVKEEIVQYPFIMVVLSFIASMCILRFAPLDSKGKPIEKDERQYIRRRAQITVCLEWGMGVLLVTINSQAAYAIWFAIIWCAVGYAGWFVDRKIRTKHEKFEVK
ncbi:MAG: accessory gene regulator B family protein [Lachnospiraceae bacterium]|nr:accessory gene regulator B family protein [Lachnospiraceae bacterium]